jgi:8-oxo-dGTP pyrophosphatase MutT (NUDIX family)
MDDVLTIPNLPLRQRVEAYVLKAAVFPTNPTTLYCGFYEDGSMGVPGGGVDDGETLAKAACREWQEETGHSAKDAAELQLPAFEYYWNPPYVTPEQTRRATRYCGSRTQFVTAVFDDTLPSHVPVDPSNLDKPGWYPVKQVVKNFDDWLRSNNSHFTGDPAGTRYRRVQQRRKAVIDSLVHFLNEGGTADV